MTRMLVVARVFNALAWLTMIAGFGVAVGEALKVWSLKGNPEATAAIDDAIHAALAAFGVGLIGGPLLFLCSGAATCMSVFLKSRRP